MNTPANPDLIEVIGDFKALQTLLRKNMTGVMLMSMLQGKEPDEVGVEIPLTVAMGMKNVIGTLLSIVKKMELVDEAAVEAYMAASFAKAAADAESIEKESNMEASSDAADECDCPACSLRRKLGSGDEDASSGIAEALAGAFGGDGEFEVREIKGQLAKQLVEVLLRGRGKAETNEEDVPPMAHRH